MKRWIVLTILLFLIGMGRVQSQTLTQTYRDRCTGKIHTFSVQMNSQTVVTFYDRSKLFTSGDFINGNLQQWLEEVYQWWSTLSPCSTNQATTTTNQQTATQAASSATSSATTATQTPTSSGTTTQTGSTTEQTSNSSSTASSETTSSEGNTSEGGESTESSESSESTEETESAEESESSEESESEESEESEDSDSSEEEEEDEEQKNLSPPIISANTVTMSMLDGSVNQAASFGYSQTSLTGQETYSANMMIWSNLKQFSLNLSKSKTIFNMDRKIPVQIEKCSGGLETIGHRDGPGTINRVRTVSGGYMKMFSTNIFTVGLSDVFLGQKENFWKGSAGGYAINGMIIFSQESNPLFVSAVTGFLTKPLAIKSLKRTTITPMIAYSATPLMVDLKTGEKIWNKNGTYIIGSNVDFQLTKRFNANIGGNLIGNTASGIPLSWMITIGSRFSF